ncbi:hypothetical protein ABZ371_19625 [Streptomyces sp. NPDC005899]|uniref:hypothetical protein n=1 Tax=Streptomyces sp. NPDC005899 TaxID=3155716 RepID=UPI0033EDBE04
MAAQLLVAELGCHVVPVGRVAHDGGGDTPTSRAGEEAGVGIGADGRDALGDEGPAFLDEKNLASPSPLAPISHVKIVPHPWTRESP